MAAPMFPMDSGEAKKVAAEIETQFLLGGSEGFHEHLTPLCADLPSTMGPKEIALLSDVQQMLNDYGVQAANAKVGENFFYCCLLLAAVVGIVTGIMTGGALPGLMMAATCMAAGVTVGLIGWEIIDTLYGACNKKYQLAMQLMAKGISYPAVKKYTETAEKFEAIQSEIKKAKQPKVFGTKYFLGLTEQLAQCKEELRKLGEDIRGQVLRAATIGKTIVIQQDSAEVEKFFSDVAVLPTPKPEPQQEDHHD